jgi:hypothetical protein
VSTFDKHIRSAAAGPQAHTPVPLQQPKNGLALASAQGGSTCRGRRGAMGRRGHGKSFDLARLVPARTPMQLRDNRVRPLMKAQ